MGFPFCYRNRTKLAAVFVLIIGFALALPAQETLQNSSIFGTITDSSGAILPGVDVSVAGASLQGKKSVVTDSDGAYRISDLPAGVYQITFAKNGFQTYVQQSFSLSAGFHARADIVLQVGHATQAIEVTAQAPIIDTSTTVTSTNLERPTLDAVPTTRSIYQAVYMAPGVRPSTTPDIGGSQLGQQQNIGSYGYNGGVTLLIDGINGTQSTSINGTDAPGNFVDYDSVEELKVISTSADADLGPAGPVVVSIMKAGGNQFHGDARVAGEPHWAQLTNLPNTVTGGSGANQLEYFYDAFADLGGRIIKDKLWFYGGIHFQRSNAAVFGEIGRNGGQGYNYTKQDNSEAKITWQATNNIKLIGDFTRATKVSPYYMGGPTVPYPSTYDYQLPFWNFKGEMVWTPNSRWLIDVLGGHMWQPYAYTDQPGTDVPGNPWTVNQDTGQTSGATHNTGSNDAGIHTRFQWTGSVSFFPNGKHSYQFGTQLYLPQKDTKEGIDHPSGNYELITKGTTTITPFQLITYNYPWQAQGKQQAVGLYFKDVWRLKPRLTLNYGLRWDYNRVYNDKEVEPTGPFSLGGSFPAQTVSDVKRIIPRVGIAYDLTGSGKTVVRASYGMFNIFPFGAFDLSNYNPAGFLTNTYSWSKDTCQVTAFTKCAPSAAFLAAITNSLSNPSATTFQGSNVYITTTGGVNAILNPNLRIPFFHTATAAIERELNQAFALRVGYVGNLEEDLYDLTFPNRPLSAYNSPFATTYPSTDPVNGGKPITILQYPASMKGGIYNQTEFINRDGHPDYFHTLEITLTKRKSNKWSALATAAFTKSHKWITGGNVFSSGSSGAQPVAPYQSAFPLDQTWDYTFRSYFTYDLPWKLNVGLTYQFLAGQPGYAMDQFSVPNLGTVTIPVDEYGSYRTSALNVLDLRVAKVVPIRERSSLEVTSEVFNVLNAAPGTTVNFINGTGAKAFGFTSVYMAPMVARFGIQFKF